MSYMSEPTDQNVSIYMTEISFPFHKKTHNQMTIIIGRRRWGGGGGGGTAAPRFRGLGQKMNDELGSYYLF